MSKNLVLPFSLSNLSVLRVSVVIKAAKTINHGDTENTENAPKDHKHDFPTDTTGVKK